jgi:hypothetical protein
MAIVSLATLAGMFIILYSCGGLAVITGTEDRQHATSP